MNEPNISIAEAALWALIASGTALWGWFGWLIIVWAILMLVDYATGSAAAKAGEWHSERAREGLWHKGGMIIMVVVAILADIVIGLAVNHLPMLELPFTYSTLLSPLVLTWYAITELGSILENAALMGAPVPPFLRRILKLASTAATAAGDQIAGDRGTDAGNEPDGDPASDAGTWSGTEDHFPLREVRFRLREDTTDGTGDSEDTRDSKARWKG